MSLETLKHRRLATVNAAAMTAASVLDAFWTAVDPTVTTYSDGSTRSFSGSGATGWTWTRVQVSGTTEALYATPPGGTMDQRVIIAARSAAPTPSPTMVSPDTFLASGLMVSHQLSAGTFTSWNSATPFTNARFMGYTRLGAAVTTYTSVAVCVYETQETIWIEMLTGGTAVLTACAGALYDPESTAAANAETDGRRYGVATAGATALASNWLGGTGTGCMWTHGTTAGNTHTYTWRPGTSTLDVVSRPWTMTGSQTTTTMTSLAGEYPGIPLYLCMSNGWAGRLREVSLGRPLLYHQRIDSASNPATIQAYGIASSTTSATGDAVFLRY